MAEVHAHQMGSSAGISPESVPPRWVSPPNTRLVLVATSVSSSILLQRQVQLSKATAYGIHQADHEPNHTLDGSHGRAPPTVIHARVGSHEGIYQAAKRGSMACRYARLDLRLYPWKRHVFEACISGYSQSLSVRPTNEISRRGPVVVVAPAQPISSLSHRFSLREYHHTVDWFLGSS